MIATQIANQSRPQTSTRAKPRVGFAGVGWIGRHRLAAIVRDGTVEIAALADPSAEILSEAAKVAPHAAVLGSLKDLLDANVDGVVIATPSALHAEQAIAALERGTAVFCQKPLGRTGAETRKVVETAREANLLLGVDLSYRHLSGVRQIHQLCREGDLGEIYAVDLTFHNAYGPDKTWFYNRQLSGGGCVIDLGIHLVDLALWMLGFPGVTRVASQLFAQGKPVKSDSNTVEDFASAQLQVSSGAVIRLTCSWKLPAGRDAVIGASFYGTKGGAKLENVDGSFYEFVAERMSGTRREILTSGPEDWGGRAAVEWARNLAAGRKFAAETESLIPAAECLDAIYLAAR